MKRKRQKDAETVWGRGEGFYSVWHCARFFPHISFQELGLGKKDWIYFLEPAVNSYFLSASLRFYCIFLSVARESMR
jgi:hypothetical protein